MKPGATTMPLASSVRAALFGSNLPIAAIVSPLIATSP